jgi:hypothetical protein
LLETHYRGEPISTASLTLTHLTPALKDPYFNDRLLRLLTAYALRNTNVGYLFNFNLQYFFFSFMIHCHVMASIAGTLLIFLEEETAFWLLVYITEELLNEYYVLSTTFLNLFSSFLIILYSNARISYRHATT